MIVDETLGPGYDAIAKVTPLFGADGKPIACEAQRRQKWLVVVDGQEEPRYDGIVRGGPTVRPGGMLKYLAIEHGVVYRVNCQP